MLFALRFLVLPSLELCVEALHLLEVVALHGGHAGASVAAEAGVFPRIATAMAFNLENSLVQVDACVALASLVIGSPERKSVAGKSQIIDRICAALGRFRKDTKVQTHAMVALWAMTAGHEENKDAASRLGSGLSWGSTGRGWLPTALPSLAEHRLAHPALPILRSDDAQAG